MPAYDRTQLNVGYSQLNDHGFDWSLEGDISRFDADSALTLQPNAQRLYGLAQISRPFISSSGYLTPKLQLHTSTYQADTALGNGNRSAESTVPPFDWMIDWSSQS